MTDTRLNDAVRSLRAEAGDERLSAETRSAILRRALEQERQTPLAVLFPTSWRTLLAGALPVAMALTVVVLAGRTPNATPAASEPVAHKTDGQVVFQVAQGATVTKSTVPFAFDPRSSVRVENGRYADQIGSGPRLVFYRIE